MPWKLWLMIIALRYITFVTNVSLSAGSYLHFSSSLESSFLDSPASFCSAWALPGYSLMRQQYFFACGSNYVYAVALNGAWHALTSN